MKEFSTNHGTVCTPDECKAIATLERAIAKWNKTCGKRLYIYGTPDGLNVMMHECKSNPLPDVLKNGLLTDGGRNQDNQITLIPISGFDCGGW